MIDILMPGITVIEDIVCGEIAVKGKMTERNFIAYPDLSQGQSGMPFPKSKGEVEIILHHAN